MSETPDTDSRAREKLTEAEKREIDSILGAWSYNQGNAGTYLTDSQIRALLNRRPATAPGVEGKRQRNPFGTGLSEPRYTATEMEAVLATVPPEPRAPAVDQGAVREALNGGR